MWSDFSFHDRFGIQESRQIVNQWKLIGRGGADERHTVIALRQT